jgi:hypothetical protein
MRAIKKSSVFAAVFLGMFVSSARAEEIVTVKIPFPFVVDQREFPAGQYEIRNVEDAGSVVSIEDVNHKSGAFVMTMRAGGSDPAGVDPALVFKKVEKEYRLSQIWESSTDGFELAGRSAADKTARADTPDGPAEARAYVVRANWK